MADTFVSVTWVADELVTSTKLNQAMANQANFHNGTALGDGIIVTRHLNVAGSLAIPTAAIAANAITAAKIETQQAWQTLTLTNGTGTASYYKDSLGIVHLSGTVNVSGTNVVLFTLPAGYRPGAISEFTHTSAGTYGQSSVSTTGVFTKTVGGNGNFGLGFVSFKAEN